MMHDEMFTTGESVAILLSLCGLGFTLATILVMVYAWVYKKWQES